ncbi:flagellar basal body L-ring protein FlgH [Thiohalobacter sp.]|uniref:flagellar basal body L-ring protein FlgH n=1 Tax=Thiohalobacter sp. TaxID=2025948 RepID=UPI00263043BB|nr:flagellar basal body L-ring protein FlgH [Thiohalobacter sp.]
MNAEARNSLVTTVLALYALLLGGCASQSVAPGNYRAAMPPVPAPPAQTDGAIYQPGYGLALFEDRTARRVGDILTIVLQEKTQASKKATTSTSKETKVNTANPTLLGSALRYDVPLLPGLKDSTRTLGTAMDSTNEFDGSGDSQQSNSLTGNISVTVAEVLPNGNLYVRGEKWLTLNQGDEYIQISGIVRPEDVKADNTVLSSQVADARITYSGRGTLADANTMGWLTRFFNSPIWPF